MYYTTIKLENGFLFFCKNGGLTGDILERCKNRWSYDGHSSFANIQSIDINLFLIESLDILLPKYVAVFENIHFS